MFVFFFNRIFSKYVDHFLYLARIVRGQGNVKTLIKISISHSYCSMRLRSLSWILIGPSYCHNMTQRASEGRKSIKPRRLRGTVPSINSGELFRGNVRALRTWFVPRINLTDYIRDLWKQTGMCVYFYLSHLLYYNPSITRMDVFRNYITCQ